MVASRHVQDVPLFGGVDRLKKKRDKIREEIREVREEIKEARQEGDDDRAQKLQKKQKDLASKMRWYDERIEDKEEEEG